MFAPRDDRDRDRDRDSDADADVDESTADAWGRRSLETTGDPHTWRIVLKHKRGAGGNVALFDPNAVGAGHDAWITAHGEIVISRPDAE